MNCYWCNNLEKNKYKNKLNFLLFRLPIYLNKPGSITHGYETKSYPPLGLLYVAGSLENAGHNVEIIDLDFEKPSKAQLEKKLQLIDAIGFEVYTDNFKEVSKYVKKLKKINSSIPIIIGGPHCIYYKEKSLNDIPEADIVVYNEAEKTILDLIDFIKNKKKLCDINNIYFKKENKIFPGKPQKLIKNLDEIPFPSRHLVDKYDYDSLPKGFTYKKKLTLMMTSRGCPSDCLFCGRYAHSIKDYGYRLRSTNNIVEEFLEIDKKYNSVMIVDDNFLADSQRAHRIFDLLIKNKTKIEILIMGARVDSNDYFLFKKMKKANVKLISFGIESGNQDVLDFYNKKINLNQIKKFVYLSREMGFQTVGTIIFGAPIETEKHIKNTIKFVKSLPLDIAIFTVLKYHMGSNLWIKAVEDGKIRDDEFLIPADSRRGLSNFTSDELFNFSRKAFISFYFRPKYIIDQLLSSIKRKNFHNFKNIFGFIKSIN
jgi:radical SAM superfamily enzyme YgiQ (UPF0313 family)